MCVFMYVSLYVFLYVFIYVCVVNMSVLLCLESACMWICMCVKSMYLRVYVFEHVYAYVSCQGTIDTNMLYIGDIHVCACVCMYVYVCVTNVHHQAQDNMTFMHALSRIVLELSLPCSRHERTVRNCHA